MFNKPPYIIYVKSLGNLSDTRTRDGLVIWPFIWVRRDDSRSKDDERTLIEHEKIHIKQAEKGWVIGFYLKYLYYHFKLGYKNNPYEIEAYQHQDEWKK